MIAYFSTNALTLMRKATDGELRNMVAAYRNVINLSSWATYVVNTYENQKEEKLVNFMNCKILNSEVENLVQIIQFELTESVYGLVVVLIFIIMFQILIALTAFTALRVNFGGGIKRKQA